ncbi:MAG: hypothetical protein M3Y27_26300, partial [Acidobacteriota bacterium]|nr:hypothetical protein [Acidobacteriota bacterium]
MAIKTQATVVAVFRSESDARAAMDDLKGNGFSSDQIFMSAEAPASGGTASRGIEPTDTARHEGGVKGWFKSLFGSEDEPNRPYVEDRSFYENAVESGNCFVSVDVDERNVDTAADVLNRHEPIDVHREAADTETGSDVRSATPTATSAATTAQRGSETRQT